MILPELDPPNNFGAEKPWLQSAAGCISRLGFDGTFGTRRRGRLRCGIDLKKQPLTHWAWVEMKTLLVTVSIYCILVISVKLLCLCQGVVGGSICQLPSASQTWLAGKPSHF